MKLTVHKMTRREDVYKDLMRIPEIHRLDHSGGHIPEGTVCKVTLTGGKSKRVAVRGCEYEDARILMDGKIRDDLGVVEGSEYDFQLGVCGWLGHNVWACSASDPAYRIPARMAIWSMGVGIIGLLLGGLSLVLARHAVANRSANLLMSPKPWNTTALKVTAPPSPVLSADLKEFRLEYVLENVSSEDYRIAESKQYRMVAQFEDDTLSSEWRSDGLFESLPVFVPAHSRVRVKLNLASMDTPFRKKLVAESDDQYREHLGREMNDELGKIFKDFRMYDDVYHYLLVFPCCALERLKEESTSK